MPVIKRYPNRKLYDTEAKRYVTLPGIAALIRQGREVQVLDHASGEDLTSLTLAQVILELEKRRGGFLPQGVLAGLIRAGGDTLAGLRRSLAGSRCPSDDEIEAALRERGVLTDEDLRLIREQLESLEAELERLGGSG